MLASLQRGVSLLILPFITHAMSPTEYGAASMLSAAALLVTAIIAAPLLQLIVRAAARGDETGPALLRAAGTYCYFIVPFMVGLAAVAVVLAVPQFLGVSGTIWGIELLAIGFQPAASTFALWVAQAREDLRHFVLLSSASVLVTAVSKVVLVVIFEMGVLGWVLSDLISAVLSAALAYFLVRLPRAQVRGVDIRYILNFSLPLIPHSAAFWALASLSRPAMAAVTTLDQVGLFAFGLSLAQLAGLILAEMNRATLPRYSRETFSAPTRETLGPVRWQLVGAFAVPATVGSGVAISGGHLFDEAYWPSFLLTGVLLIGQAAFGLYMIPMNYLTQTAELPRYSALASGAGAALILLSIVFFGHLGGFVVALATTAGYVTMASVAITLVIAHKLDIVWRSWLRNWPEVLIAAAALACSVAALTFPIGSATALVLSGICLTFVSCAVIITARGGRRTK